MEDDASSGANTAKSTKSTSSVHDIGVEKPPFGSRFLTDEAEVWSQNAWDHVPPPDDQLEVIEASISKQKSAPVPDEDKAKYNEKPARHWDNFYKMNASNFFRNRKWLHNEFPELVDATQSEAGPVSITEVGCGAGNSVFPLLSTNKNSQLVLRAYDYSTHAVKLVQNNALYQSPPAGSIHAAVWDVTSRNGLPAEVEPESVDIVILVFVLSALHPDEWGRAISNIHKMLKPGGLVLLRDYGRHDLTQLRFKAGRLLDENFYIRGDKTRVYFFELDELALLFTGARALAGQTTDHTTEELEEDASEASSPARPGSSNFTEAPISDAPSPSTPISPPTSDSTTRSSPASIHPNLLSPLADCPPQPLFMTEQLGVDRRLLVNRKRQLKMYRVWMQGKFRKVS
ncbi:tRNA(Thr) (cytosine(32)-N(3))-methyltransferase [Hypsizygus marmoreus]|uniref:tRNA N(3)-methylcytidine methyltransferase n=1 Tax=Hypsizygus marmoreus TaxID=39966 RepID=A0A369JGJ1_HYPMA|nr:tRNA(Thr) (cytosine(32)-N(3))-methyltransferase [Hypsizygus marmoreus]